jgi:hypothetical protein
MVGCVSKPKAEIVLPPKPQREIMPEVKSMKDVAELVNYYEHLVQEWEVWCEDATTAIEKTNIIIYQD